MNRRDFLVSAATVAVTAPVVSLASPTPAAPDIGITQRHDLLLMPWQIHEVREVSGRPWEFTLLLDHCPTEGDLARYRGYADEAFQRALARVA